MRGGAPTYVADADLQDPRQLLRRRGGRQHADQLRHLTPRRVPTVGDDRLVVVIELVERRDDRRDTVGRTGDLGREVWQALDGHQVEGGGPTAPEASHELRGEEESSHLGLQHEPDTVGRAQVDPLHRRPVDGERRRVVAGTAQQQVVADRRVAIEEDLGAGGPAEPPSVGQRLLQLGYRDDRGWRVHGVRGDDHVVVLPPALGIERGHAQTGDGLRVATRRYEFDPQRALGRASREQLHARFDRRQLHDDRARSSDLGSGLDERRGWLGDPLEHTDRLRDARRRGVAVSERCPQRVAGDRRVVQPRTSDGERLRARAAFVECTGELVVRLVDRWCVVGRRLLERGRTRRELFGLRVVRVGRVDVDGDRRFDVRRGPGALGKSAVELGVAVVDGVDARRRGGGGRCG